MKSNIVDQLRQHAQTKPDATAFRFLADATLAPQPLSYAQLWQDAGAVAQLLSERAAPGSRVMLFFAPGLAYIKAFYGCLLAGMVAVPLYPPRRNAKSDRIVNVAASCGARIALTSASELGTVQAAWQAHNRAELPLELVAIDDLAAQTDAADRCASPAPDDAAFLQYTSGSTGAPKGVIVTHANIVANAGHLTAMVPTGPDDVFVNWVPAFHDLGLVMGMLVPVMLGAQSVLMAPASFVREPVQWLRAISLYRGTRCGAPNFAFDLCVDKIADADLAQLDLSSWRVAYNAAEPVRADTLARFNARFSVCGFRPETFFPSYGMAEATLAISGPAVDAPPRVITVERQALGELRVRRLADGDPAGTQLVGCGAAHAPHALRVVDPHTGLESEPGRVGEIWFSGPSVSPGYWDLPELSQATFGNTLAGDARRYLRTGDLGVQVEDELFIVGRIKDLIILRGRNYYPQDLEAAAARAHHAVRPGHVAAFAVDHDGEERLVIVAELEREHLRSVDTEEVIGAIRRQLAQEHELAPERVVLLRPYKIPMTSSGKIQRRQTRAMLADGSLETLAESGASPAAIVRPPSTATEHTLERIWCSVLERSPISIDANFFELGGDSLAAAEIATMLDGAFPGLAPDLSQLHDYPTIEALARWLDLAQAHAARDAAPITTPMKTIAI